MSGDYLWDKTGEDPEVQHLEELLRPYRYEAGPPAPKRQGGWGPWLLAAMALLAVSGGGLWLSGPGSSEDPSWGLATADCADCALDVGTWLETEETWARLAVADIGHMDIGPDSRLRILRTGVDEHRLELAVGRVDAVVNAPPRLLIVETPGATAVDLGCAYTLEVDEAGMGRLEVTSGWVALEEGGLSSQVPAGAKATTVPGRPPGLPRFVDASEAFHAAVTALDAGDSSALPDALELARPRDTLTLWHALFRVDGAAREAVLDRIEALAPGQPTVDLDRERLLVLDEVQTDALFGRLIGSCF